MKSINFEIGNYKEYAINGDESNTIKLDVSDIGLLNRFKTAMTEIKGYQKELSSINSPSEDIFEQMDKKAREIVNKAFDCDVCAKAFGNKNCFSTASNGEPILLNFLEAFIPIITKDFGQAATAQKTQLEAKTEKYTAPVVSKTPTAGLAHPYGNALPDVSGLSAEEKRALIAQLIC